MVFQSETLDFKLSPYTGLTREGWIEAGRYLLRGIFGHIKSYDDPIIMPRTETDITYPHLKDSLEEQKIQQLAEIFEGITRSFFIAAPLMKDEPEMRICDFIIKDYYKKMILQCCTKGSSIYVGNYEEQKEISKIQNPYKNFQQTVETCALVIGLWISKEQIWDTYSKEEKDTIARLISSYAMNNTGPQNWRLFNMLDMAFLHQEGYEIDKEMMLDHAQAILHYYAGDGWYRDGDCYDYYSAWAFNLYAPMWNLWYGYENVPYIANKFEEYSNKLMETYPDFFDKDGFTNMWGRSGIYRNASTAAFLGNMLLKNPQINYGLARRIMSGSLLQFLSRDDFLENGIPSLGFYGQFMPLIQSYSCAESPFWLGKAFLCLYLGKDHPFWTQKENNGTWDKLRNGEVKVTTLTGPGLCCSDHDGNGSTILRTAKVIKGVNVRHGIWNYIKLCYHTKYPWESSSQDHVESQQYVIKDEKLHETERANASFWVREKEGVLYRRQVFSYGNKERCHWSQAIDLADFPVTYGLFRVDKLRLNRRPVEITLGSFGFPDNGTEIIQKEKEGARAIVLKGRDAEGNEKQVAMTVYDGWDRIDYMKSKGTNPDSVHSILVYSSTKRKKQYGYEPYIMISQVITKENLSDFTDDDLFPVQRIAYTDPEGCGGYGPITVELKNGDKKVINFEEIEGDLQI